MNSALRFLGAFGYGLAVLLLARSALANEFSDFRIPAHHATSWSADLALSGSRNVFIQPQDEERGHFGNGLARTRASWFFDSEPSAFSVTAETSANGHRSADDGERQSGTATFESESRVQDIEERWAISVGHRRYPWATPVALEVTGLAVGNYRQSWGSQRSDDRQPDLAEQLIREEHHVRWDYVYHVTASAGVGLGRVRDATRIYDTHVIEQRLIASGAIARPLSSEARARLASLLYLQGSYGLVRDRPLKYLWREIERILRDDQALTDQGLDPYSVMQATEPSIPTRFASLDRIAPSPFTRLRGAFAGLVVMATHDHQAMHDDASRLTIATTGGITTTIRTPIEARFSAEGSDVFAGPRAEFHDPWALGWQLDAAGALLFPVDDPRNGLESSASASVQALVADRWSAGVSAGYARSYGERSVPFRGIELDRWSVNYGATLNFYLEDRTELRVQVVERQEHIGDRQPAVGYRNDWFGRIGQASVAIAYRFIGSLTAPGLIEPVRIGVPAD